MQRSRNMASRRMALIPVWSPLVWSPLPWLSSHAMASEHFTRTCAETPAGSVLAVISWPTHWGDGLRLGYIPRSGICFTIVTNASRCTPHPPPTPPPPPPPPAHPTPPPPPPPRAAPRGGGGRTKTDQALASIVSKG